MCQFPWLPLFIIQNKLCVDVEIETDIEIWSVIGIYRCFSFHHVTCPAG